MRGWKGDVGAVGLALLLAGCAGDASEPESELLGKDTGIRCGKSRVPTVQNMA